MAFYKGVKDKTNSEIYVPWNAFNVEFLESPEEALPILEKDNEVLSIIVKQFHPNFYALRQGGLKLMQRNVYQVLGYGLHDPSDFLICYTKDSKITGGTALAMKIAHSANVSVINLGRYKNELEHIERIVDETIDFILTITKTREKK